MTTLTSANGSLPLTLRKGETLIVRNYSGTETVTGSTAAREDASATLGAGAYAYGPQTTDATVTLSTTGSLDYQVVSGDVSPAVEALVTLPSRQIVTPSGDVVGGGGGSASGPFRQFAHAAAAASANFTLILQHPAKAAYYGFRAVYANYGAAQTITQAKAVSAPTTQNGGNTLTWSQVTFGGSNSGSQGAGSGSGQDIVPSILVSDYVMTPSVARSDFPERTPLAQVRTHYAAGSTQAQVFGNAFGDYLAATGLEFGSRIPSGDQVTSTTSDLPPLVTGTWMCPVGLDFLYGVPTENVADVGDSLFAGQESGTTSAGWLSVSERACRLNQTNSALRVWQSASFAIRGQTHNASYLTGLEVVSKLKPKYLCFRASSPNDGTPTQALMDAAWARTLALIEHCRVNGVIPVICTSTPINSYTAGQDALLKAQNVRVRSLSGVVRVSDEAGVIESPTNASQIRSEFSGGDGTHINSAGYQAMAEVRAAVLS